MISASEARAKTREAQFAESGYAQLADSTIREACSNGDDSAIILVPVNVVDDMVLFLVNNGYEHIAVAGAITGAMVTVVW
jgi:hypothetical protein